MSKDPPELKISISEVPVGAPGTATLGSVVLTSIEDVFDVALSASDLVSGAHVLPGAAITFQPDLLGVMFGSSYTVGVSVQIPSDLPIGTYTGTVTASAGVIQTQMPLTVVVNSPPVLSVPGPQKVRAGDTLSFDISATDVDGDQIVLSADLLPDGAELIDHGDGTGTFTFGTKATDAGLRASVVLFASNPLPEKLSELGDPPQDAREVLISVIPAHEREKENDDEDD
jgi:hypothetical protein